MKHTPAPWTYKNSPGAGHGIWADLRPALGERFSKDFPIYASGDLPAPKVQIAYGQWVQFPSDEWDAMQIANGALMAAAPDLLAALQEVSRLDNADRIASCSTGEPVTTYAFQEAMARVDAAIAKATGEPV